MARSRWCRGGDKVEMVVDEVVGRLVGWRGGWSLGWLAK